MIHLTHKKNHKPIMVSSYVLFYLLSLIAICVSSASQLPETETPSYVRLCQVILDPPESSSEPLNIEIKESSEVMCDSSRLHNSILHILTSSYMTQLVNQFDMLPENVNLNYNHRHSQLSCSAASSSYEKNQELKTKKLTETVNLGNRDIIFEKGFEDKDFLTIQQILRVPSVASEVILSDYWHKLEHTKNTCRLCMDQHSDSFFPLECLLFSSEQQTNNEEGQNFEKKEQGRRYLKGDKQKENQSMRSLQQRLPSMFEQMGGIEFLQNIMQDTVENYLSPQSYQFDSFRMYDMNKHAFEMSHYHKAIIYLPCEPSPPVPLFLYIMNIPFNIHRVEIIVCQTPIYDQHDEQKSTINERNNEIKNTAKQMRGFFETKYPNLKAPVQVTIFIPFSTSSFVPSLESNEKYNLISEFPIISSSALLHAKFMAAPLLLCLTLNPDDDNLCLLPALSRANFQREDIDSLESSDVVSYEYNNYKTSIIPTFSLRDSLVEKIPPTKMPYNIKWIDVENQNIGKDGRCRFIRGKFGKWKLDFYMAAASLQYETPLLHQACMSEIEFRKLSNKENSNMVKIHSPSEFTPAFRMPTSYIWETTHFPICNFFAPSSPGNGKSYQLVKYNSFCNIFSGKLGISRVFMVGDSLQQSQAFGLWKLLGFKDDPISRPDIGKNGPNFKRTIQCAGEKEVELVFVRNDQIIENDLPVSIPDKIGNCAKFCHKWSEEYSNYPMEKRTLLVASAGSHFSTTASFQRAFSDFYLQVRKLKRKNDIVLFRTSVPGHEGCDSFGKHGEVVVEPFESYNDYKPTISTMYSWDIFIEHNKFAEQVIYNHNIARSSNLMEYRDEPIIELLDVYPMTVLRRDGHIGGKLFVNNCVNIEND